MAHLGRNGISVVTSKQEKWGLSVVISRQEWVISGYILAGSGGLSVVTCYQWLHLGRKRGLSVAHLGRNGLSVVTSWQEAGLISDPSWQEWFIIGYILAGSGTYQWPILAGMVYHWLHLGRKRNLSVAHLGREWVISG